MCNSKFIVSFIICYVLYKNIYKPFQGFKKFIQINYADFNLFFYVFVPFIKQPQKVLLIYWNNPVLYNIYNIYVNIYDI